MHHIQSRPNTFYAGVTSTGNRVLLGWQDDLIVLFLFGVEGELCKVRREPVEVDLSKGLGPFIEEQVNKQIQSLQAKVGFQEKPIVVAPFSIPELRIGLKVLPDYLEDYMKYPDPGPTH